MNRILIMDHFINGIMRDSDGVAIDIINMFNDLGEEYKC